MGEERPTESKQLNKTRALNNARKEDYMYAKEDVLNVEAMLKEAREEVGIQKNIVRSQNRRLEMVEQHLMASKTESEHNSLELNKIRNKMKLYQKENDQANKYKEQVTAGGSSRSKIFEVFCIMRPKCLPTALFYFLACYSINILYYIINIIIYNYYYVFIVLHVFSL